MKITIVGTGYQGLVVGTCLAENGHQVACVDRDAARIAALAEGQPPIHEPGLEELVRRNLEEERLRFTTDLTEAVEDCLLIMVCVGTAFREDGEADLTGVFDAVREVADAMTGYRIIVNKSTCPIGTSEQIAALLKENTTHPFDMVVNPDFLKEGAAIHDFMAPDRIVVGCEDVRVQEIMKELYSPFLRTGKPFLNMAARSAEMTKYATNAMLASRISLMNEIADICAAWGADIGEVREGLASDDRIGSTYLFPGLGFGGLGLPKDLATCIKLADEKGLGHDLLDAILSVNTDRLNGFIQQILDHFGGDLTGKRIALWGASFKPRTDDLRGAPALQLIDGLRGAGAEICVYDPVAGPKLREQYGDGVKISPKYYQALEGADALAVVTEWNEFRRPDYERMGTLMKEKVIFNGRNLYTPAVMKENGFHYVSIGRPAV